MNALRWSSLLLLAHVGYFDRGVRIDARGLRALAFAAGVVVAVVVVSSLVDVEVNRE